MAPPGYLVVPCREAGLGRPTMCQSGQQMLRCGM